jgi:hypothetical protein
MFLDHAFLKNLILLNRQVGVSPIVERVIRALRYFPTLLAFIINVFDYLQIFSAIAGKRKRYGRISSPIRLYSTRGTYDARPWGNLSISSTITVWKGWLREGQAVTRPPAQRGFIVEPLAAPCSKPFFNNVTFPGICFPDRPAFV